MNNKLNTPSTPVQAPHTSHTSSTLTSSLTWEPDWSSVPSSPGVYWFSDAAGNVLYVGKAKDLSKRMRSYTRVAKHSERIAELVRVARTQQWQICASELEALLIEAELIRTYQPPFNVLLKDDKSPLYVLFTAEAFPRVLAVRKPKSWNSQPDHKRNIPRKKSVACTENEYSEVIFGPFPSSQQLREVLQLVRPIFPWCNQKIKTGKPCFYHHLGLCPGACAGLVSQEEYHQQLRQLQLFLKGKASEVVALYTEKMRVAVQGEAFEQAGKYRDALAAIAAITNPKYRLKPNIALPGLRADRAQDGITFLKRILRQDMALPAATPLQTIEAYDVSNTSGTLATVAQVSFTDGRPNPSQYRLYNIRSLDTPNDYQMMKEALVRRQNHPEWGWPDLIVIDGGKGQLRAALSVWHILPVPIISLAKNPDRIIVPRWSWPIVTRSYPPSLKGLEYTVRRLAVTDPALQLLQHLRDEAHRFSNSHHAKRRTKTLTPI